MSYTTHDILAAYRTTSRTKREKGTDFEEFVRSYFRYESAASLDPITFYSNANRI